MSRAPMLTLVIIGGFAPVFALAALLDQTKSYFVPPVMAASFFIAGGMIAGYVAPGRIWHGLVISWAIVPPILLFFAFSLTSPDQPDLSSIGFLLAGIGIPVILSLLGAYIGSLVSQRRQSTQATPGSIRDLKTVARILVPGAAVVFLAFTPVYALDRTIFRDPVFEVTLLGHGGIELSRETVRDGPSGIEYRVTNVASEPRALSIPDATFDAGLGGEIPSQASKTLQPGESIDLVMAISGGTGPGQFHLCNSPDGGCVVLTIT